MRLRQSAKPVSKVCACARALSRFELYRALDSSWTQHLHTGRAAGAGFQIGRDDFRTAVSYTFHVSRHFVWCVLFVYYLLVFYLFLLV